MTELSITDFFFSADAKFNWASDNFKTLKQELVGWFKDNPISTVVKHNPDSTEISVYARVAEEPAWKQWSLILGDCLHNFRSALDHAIYGLAVAHSEQNPPPHADSLLFPISNSQSHFQNSLDRLGDLRRVGVVLEAVQGLQPYMRRNLPHPPTLALLRDLNDVDKHRIINITRAAAKGGSDKFVNLPPRATVKFRHFLRGPLKDGTLLSRFYFDRPAPKFDVEGNITVFPAIRHVDAAGKPHQFGVDWVVKQVQDEVAYCLDEHKRVLPKAL